ncbi:MAG: putative maltokinase [Candidatus Cyclobacteriaceae bacterium M2_1C_046]
MKEIQSNSSWDKFFEDHHQVKKLEDELLPGYVKKCRWFGGKAKKIDQIKISLHIPFSYADSTAYLVVIKINYQQDEPEQYFLPLTFIREDSNISIDETPITTVAELNVSNNRGKIIDAVYDQRFRNHLFKSMAENKTKKAGEGTLLFVCGSKADLTTDLSKISSEVLKADQSNTSIIYNKEYFFKFYRKIEKEINSDVEIVKFLSEKTSFENSPTFAGSVEFTTKSGDIVFGLLQEMVKNKGEAWGMTMEYLNNYFEKVLSGADDQQLSEHNRKVVLFPEEAPRQVRDLIGKDFTDKIMKLGQRTAEMHLALASDHEDQDFAPVDFDIDYQKSLFNSMQELTRNRINLLRQKFDDIPERVKSLGKEIIDSEEYVIDAFDRIRERKLNEKRTRIHGDYHLGQVLFTGDDFVIIDYEGEPGFSFAERRVKKSPFKDVAGMVRSFHYAAYSKLLLNENFKEKYKELQPWAEQWYQYISKFYLAAYLDRMGMDNLSKDNKTLFEVYTLEKAVYELGYELNSRPDWVGIPLRGINFLIDQYTKNK